jgi:hypothetical protein
MGVGSAHALTTQTKDINVAAKVNALIDSDVLLDFLVLCNRYGLPIAARSLGEFQEASEAPVYVAILAERVTRKFAQRTAARRVELKMARRLRCVSVAGRKGHAPSSRLGGGPF